MKLKKESFDLNIGLKQKLLFSKTFIFAKAKTSEIDALSAKLRFGKVLILAIIFASIF
jgi:hypothetical protein